VDDKTIRAATLQFVRLHLNVDYPKFLSGVDKESLQFGSSNSPEVEISEIHVPFLENMNSENVFSVRKSKPHNPCYDVAMMPLASGNWILELNVDTIATGPLASFPFTSKEMAPPRFEVYRRSAL
jgi:hypothetical protein